MSLLDTIARDSGNANVPNAQGSGATGYFQIIGSNWRKIGQGVFGYTAPNAMSATPVEQATVAQYLNNQSGGLANWGQGQFWQHLSIFDKTANAPITTQDVADFGMSHGDTSLAALSSSATMPNTSLGGLSFDKPGNDFVNAPSGFGSGLTAGALGNEATNIAVPDSNLVIGNAIPGTITNPAAKTDTSLSVSPDLAQSPAVTDPSLMTTPQTGTDAFGRPLIGPGELTGQSAPGTSQLIPNLIEDALGYFQRGMIVILGVVLIAIAAYALARDSSVIPQLARARA